MQVARVLSVCECYTQNHDLHSHLDPPHPLKLLYVKKLYYIFPDQHASAGRGCYSAYRGKENQAILG